MRRPAPRHPAFTMVELLLVLLLGAVVSLAVFRTISRQGDQGRALAMRVEMETEARRVLAQLSDEISKGGFNPLGQPFSNSTLSQQINFLCLQSDKLYFASDRVGEYPKNSGTLIDHNPDRSINSLAPPVSACTGPCNCDRAKVDAREVTLLEVRRRDGCSVDCPYVLYRNGRTSKNDTALLDHLVRLTFTYKLADGTPFTFNPANPYDPANPPDPGNPSSSTYYPCPCPLSRITIDLVARTAAPIRGFRNQRFTTPSAVEKDLVFNTQSARKVGDYDTLAIQKEVVLVNRGSKNFAPGFPAQPLCFQYPPPTCPAP